MSYKSMKIVRERSIADSGGVVIPYWSAPVTR